MLGREGAIRNTRTLVVDIVNNCLGFIKVAIETSNHIICIETTLGEGGVGVLVQL